MVNEELMRNRVNDIKETLGPYHRWKYSDNEIKKLEDELEILETYLI